jgi:hypothetical protein
MSKDLSEED